MDSWVRVPNTVRAALGIGWKTNRLVKRNKEIRSRSGICASRWTGGRETKAGGLPAPKMMGLEPDGQGRLRPLMAFPAVFQESFPRCRPARCAKTFSGVCMPRPRRSSVASMMESVPQSADTASVRTQDAAKREMPLPCREISAPETEDAVRAKTQAVLRGVHADNVSTLGPSDLSASPCSRCHDPSTLLSPPVPLDVHVDAKGITAP